MAGAAVLLCLYHVVYTVYCKYCIYPIVSKNTNKNKKLLLLVFIELVVGCWLFYYGVKLVVG